MKILGIDVGGSGIKGAIVDTDLGELVTETNKNKKSEIFGDTRVFFSF